MADGAAVSVNRAQEEPGRLMRWATYLSVGIAVVLIIVKGSAWLATDSVALLSSLIDSLLDAIASLLNLLAVRHALQPADRQHRFGHGKAEPLAGLGQSAFIVVSSLLLVAEAVHRLVDPHPVINPRAGFIAMGISVVLCAGLVAYQRMVVRRTGSVAIGSDFLHYSGDLLLNLSVVLSLLLTSRFGLAKADPLLAIGIAAFLLYGSVRIGWRAFHLLMDHEFPESDRDRIQAICRGHPDVIDVHDLRTRSAGQSSFIQLHLELDANMTLYRAHVISEEVEAGIRRAFPSADVIIHQDPEGMGQPRDRFR